MPSGYQVKVTDHDPDQPEKLSEADHPLNDETASPPSDEELREVVAIFKQARRGLTEDSAAAALALKRAIAIHQTLLGLLLDGEMAAEVIDVNKTLVVSNFMFVAWPPDQESETKQFSQPGRSSEEGGHSARPTATS